MNDPFDLIAARWVPCIQPDGTPVELGLRDVLARAHELRELYGESPVVTASLYRLLLAVLHRVFGPADYDVWAVLWEAGRFDPDALDAYLGRWQHRFDLFGADRPFFQSADERVKPKSVASLIHDVASGHNATLFDHHTDEQGPVLSPAEAARMLIAAQSFGLAGLSGLVQKFTDGTCASGIVFVVEGQNLFETLALNMMPYPDDQVMPCQPGDRPAWEMDDPFAPERSLPLGYLDYLTWQNRRVLFLPEAGPGGPVVRQMTMAPALRMDGSVQNPMSHHRIDEKRGPLPLTFEEERALWRDSSALFELRSDSQRPPRTFHWLAELVDEGVLDRSQTRRCLALGMSKKQAKVFFYRGERLPLPLAYLQDRDLVASLETVLAMAERARGQLWGAARTLATFVLSPEADAEGGRQPDPKDLDALTQGWGVERRYWSELELPFRHVIEALTGKAREETISGWREVVRRAAWEALAQAADGVGEGPYDLKAAVRARGQLAGGLAKVFPES